MRRRALHQPCARRAADPATKSFTEQHILSAMTVQYLQKKGFQVQPQTNIATVISRNAMINKQIDMTSGVHRHVADHLQPHQQTHVAAGVIRDGETPRREARSGVA